jgi:hypothetical protein
MSLRVVTPSGDFDDLPPEELDEVLREIFLADPEGYWSRSGGDAGLHFDDGEVHARLVLLYQAGRGYYVSYYRSGEGTERVLQRDEGPEAAVTIYFGGEPMKVSSRMFVTPPEAWDAIVQFIKNAQRSAPRSGLSWQPTGRV